MQYTPRIACDRWANNDGGLWCHRHPYQIPEGACETCEDRKEIQVATVVLPYSYGRLKCRQR